MSQSVGAGYANNDLKSTASYLAEQLTRVFQAHDVKDKNAALEACREVDRGYFPHVDDDKIEIASNAFVDALWEKDEVEFRHLRNGELDRDGLAKADWNPVQVQFRKRAAALGIEQEYAEYKTTGWRRHKVGGDYLTPFQQAQVLELRAALQDPTYPHKPRYGQSGPGPEAVRYTVGVELHDMHTEDHWEQAQRVLVPYFERVLQERDSYGNPTFK